MLRSLYTLNFSFVDLAKNKPIVARHCSIQITIKNQSESFSLLMVLRKQVQTVLAIRGIGWFTVA